MIGDGGGGWGMLGCNNPIWPCKSPGVVTKRQIETKRQTMNGKSENNVTAREAAHFRQGQGQLACTGGMRSRTARASVRSRTHWPTSLLADLLRRGCLVVPWKIARASGNGDGTR